jgi:hypothetical protein
MFKSTILLYAFLNISNPSYADTLPMTNPPSLNIFDNSSAVLSTKSFSLDNRYDNDFVNSVFKDNILLTLNYLEGNIKSKEDIIWGEIEKPAKFTFTLNPGESFAFHDQILPEYDNNVVKTTNAHFNYQDGFKSDGYLMGDGVCHLASIIYWAAKDAGLDAYAPTSHDFAKINEVPKEYGVSIYSLPGGFDKSARENLYIQNNLDTAMTFTFIFDGKDLSITISKDN